MAKLQGKVALVTGAGGTGAGGMGRSIALKLAKEGARVSVVDLNENGGQATITDIKKMGGDAYFIKCDVSDVNNVQSVITETVKVFGKINILVNNAYVYDSSDAKIADYSLDDWNKQISVNLNGYFYFTKFALPELLKTEKPSIINISSVASVASDDKGIGYGATKAAINALTEYTAVQYGRDGLRANTVLPGLILSDDMEEQVAKDPGLTAFFKAYDQNIVLPHHGKPENVADVVAFLASDEASFITKQKIFVDGGMYGHASELATMRQLKEYQG